MAWVCDQNEDCTDKSDEAACSKCERVRTLAQHLFHVVVTPIRMDFIFYFFFFSSILQTRRAVRTNLHAPTANAFSSGGIVIGMMIAAMAAMN